MIIKHISMFRVQDNVSMDEDKKACNALEDMAYMSSLALYSNTYRTYSVSHIVGKML